MFPWQPDNDDNDEANFCNNGISFSSKSQIQNSGKGRPFDPALKLICNIYKISITSQSERTIWKFPENGNKIQKSNCQI